MFIDQIKTLQREPSADGGAWIWIDLSIRTNAGVVRTDMQQFFCCTCQARTVSHVKVDSECCSVLKHVEIG